MSWDLAANDVPHQLLIVEGGGHEFDSPGEHPPSGIAQAIADFFVRTIVDHEPVSDSTKVGTLPAGDDPSGTTGTTDITGTTGTTGVTSSTGATASAAASFDHS